MRKPPPAPLVLGMLLLAVIAWERSRSRRTIRQRFEVEPSAVNDRGDEEALLARKIDALDLDHASFDTLVLELSRKTGLNVVADRQYAANHEPITLHLHHSTLAGALSAALGPRDVFYGFDHGIVLIGSSPSREEAFDLRPFLTSRAGSPTGGSLFGDESSTESLGQEIRSSVEVNWSTASGGFLLPSMPSWHGRLVPHESLRVRRRIRGVLRAMEQTDQRATVSAGAPPAITASPMTTQPADREPTLEEKLNERHPELTLDQMSLRKAIDVVAGAWHVNIVLDRSSSEAVADREWPEREHLTNVNLAEALDVVLAQLSGATPDQRMTYRVEDDIITIGYPQALGIVGITKVYDVRDLVDAAAAYGHPLPPATQALSKSSAGASADGTSAPQALAPRTAEEQEGRNLCDVIRASLADVTHGGQLNYWSGRLVVMDVPAMHRRIERLLSDLRKTSIHPAPTTAPAR